MEKSINQSENEDDKKYGIEYITIMNKNERATDDDDYENENCIITKKSMVVKGNNDFNVFDKFDKGNNDFKVFDKLHMNDKFVNLDIKDTKKYSIPKENIEFSVKSNSIDFHKEVDIKHLPKYVEDFIQKNYSGQTLNEASDLFKKIIKYVEIFKKLNYYKKNLNQIKKLSFEDAINWFDKFEKNMRKEDYRVLQYLIFENLMSNCNKDDSEILENVMERIVMHEVYGIDTTEDIIYFKIKEKFKYNYIMSDHYKDQFENQLFFIDELIKYKQYTKAILELEEISKNVTKLDQNKHTHVIKMLNNRVLNYKIKIIDFQEKEDKKIYDSKIGCKIKEEFYHLLNLFLALSNFQNFNSKESKFLNNSLINFFNNNKFNSGKKLEFKDEFLSLFLLNRKILIKEKDQHEFALNFFIGIFNYLAAEDYYRENYDFFENNYNKEVIINIDNFFDECSHFSEKIKSNKNIIPSNVGNPNNINSNTNNSKKLKILSLDGGGIKGLIHLYILSEMEFCCNNKPIYELFNTFFGTSIGGIIALLFASKKYTAHRLFEKMLGDMKDEIFGGKNGHF